MKHFILLPALLMLFGCAQLDKIPDDQLAKDLHIGAEKAVQYGLKLLLRKVSAADAVKVAADCRIADDILTKNIIPLFSGADTDVVLRSAVDTALALLKSKIANSKVIDQIDLGVEILVTEVPLPKNPADKIDVRTKKLIAGVLGGIVAGIEDVFAPTTPVPPPVVPRDPLTIPK